MKKCFSKADEKVCVKRDRVDSGVWERMRGRKSVCFKRNSVIKCGSKEDEKKCVFYVKSERGR